MATCKGCGEPIVFLKTARGNLIPVDDNETAQAYLRDRSPFDSKDPQLFPHFRRCPDSERFRKT